MSCGDANENGSRRAGKVWQTLGGRSPVAWRAIGDKISDTREAVHVILTHDSLWHKATVSAVMRTFVDMFGRQVSHFAPRTLIVLQRKKVLRSHRSLTLSAQPAKKSMPGQVVICGGGIIGVATAYYLTLQGIKPLLVEKSGIACAASGALQAEAKI